MKAEELVDYSISLPAEYLEELKQFSAERGKSSKLFAGEIITDFIKKTGVKPPTADQIIEKLKQAQSEFEAENVTHLSLFGSVARGDAHYGSDIDLVAEFDCGVGVKKWGRTKKIAIEVLGEKYKIDLVPSKSLKREIRESAMKDAVIIF